MDAPERKPRLSPEDWVMAGLRSLVRGGPAALRVEPLARDLGTTKGSFYWHFKDMSELHLGMLEFWEGLATTAIAAAVRASGRDGRGQLMLLIDMASVRPGAVYGGIEVEPALREWGRIDRRAREVVERVDRRRLADLAGFLLAAGAPAEEVGRSAQTLYAAVIGLESLRMTTGAEMAPALQGLALRLIGEPAPAA